MPERLRHITVWTSIPTTLLLLLLLHVTAGNVAISPSSDVRSTSASASSANQRAARSADPVNSLVGSEEDNDDEDGCSSDFMEKFFRLLSGSVGKEGEALVAAVLKLLSENDRVNWPIKADWTPAREVIPVSKLQEMFLEGSRKFRGAVKRLAPKFNPTGWRRRRSADRPETSSTSFNPYPFLHPFLAKLQAARMLEEGYVIPKLAEDDVKLVPVLAEWQDEGKRSGTDSVPERVFRRQQPQGMPKRKPLEFNPTGW